MRGHIAFGLVVLALLSVAPAHAQMLAAAGDITQLSIEQLANVEITTVSKKAQSLSDVAAAAYVVSQDDILRSGVTSIPEMLRLTPNLEVMQTSPSNYIITARGFNGNNAAQNFPDKLLVLIDGRSVYSPLFSGVYWDMQDVLPENVERIEVVSGPGGTLWGANAVNGVVNIVTRKADDTSGGLLDLGAGNLQSSAALQYGGKLDDDLAYRVYAKDFYARNYDTAAGANAHDGWGKPQGGFRLDWGPDKDLVTLQGDLYGGSEGQSSAANQIVSGGNLTAHWNHPLDGGSTLDTLAYFDRATRSSADGGSFTINTYNLELQHNFSLGSWNNIVWGAGDRIDVYTIGSRISAASSLIFSPPSRTLNLADLFAEDHIPLGDRVQLSLGLKLENDPYSGITPMPSGRLSWKVGANDLLWAAVSRAVRSPTPFDVDVVEKLGSVTFLKGNAGFLPEDVIAYEVGYRGQLSSSLSLSLSLFQDVYNNLKSIEFSPAGGFPLQWGNDISGNIHGLEAWASYQATDWWRLSAGVNWQHEDLRFVPGASKLLGLSQAGDDPHHQASLRSSIRLSDDLNFDADLRDVGKLANPAVPEYVELNSRLGWRVSPTLELSLSGFNLLHARHLEYQTGGGDEIPRSFFVESRWHF